MSNIMDNLKIGTLTCSRLSCISLEKPLAETAVSRLSVGLCG